MGFTQVSGTEAGTSIDKRGVSFTTFQSCLSAAADSAASADTTKTTIENATTPGSDFSLSTSAASGELRSHSSSIAAAAASTAATRGAAALNKFKETIADKGGRGPDEAKNEAESEDEHEHEDAEDEALSAAWQVFTKYPGPGVKFPSNKPPPSPPSTPSSFSSPPSSSSSSSSSKKAKLLVSPAWTAGAAAALGISPPKKEAHKNTVKNTVSKDFPAKDARLSPSTSTGKYLREQKQKEELSRLQRQLPAGIPVFNDWGDDDTSIASKIKKKGATASSSSTGHAMAITSSEDITAATEEEEAHAKAREDETNTSDEGEPARDEEATGLLEWAAAQPAKKFAFKLSVPLVPYYATEEEANEVSVRQKEQQSKVQDGDDGEASASAAAEDSSPSIVLRRTVLQHRL